MTNQEALSIISSGIPAKEAELAAFKAAAKVLTDGYQSDMTAARAEVAQIVNSKDNQISTFTKQVVALTTRATEAETALATEQAAHTTDNETKDQQIADLTAQVTALTPVPTE